MNGPVRPSVCLSVCPSVCHTFLYARLKNGTYYAVGRSVRPSVRPDCELKMECNCSNSQFSDKVTGDLHIIKNQKLRELFKKGPNYREKKAINWKKTMSLLKEDIKLFINKWSDRAGIPEECFSEWKITLFKVLLQCRGLLKLIR